LDKALGIFGTTITGCHALGADYEVPFEGKPGYSFIPLQGTVPGHECPNTIPDEDGGVTQEFNSTAASSALARPLKLRPVCTFRGMFYSAFQLRVGK
jgi:hypothetical protein